MYTGIVEQCGIVVAVSRADNSLRLAIRCHYDDLKEGESIAINGVCVTVVESQTKQFQCDISPETCRLTNLGLLQKNNVVNLERSLAVSDRLGGHIVQGHIDKSVTVIDKQAYDPFVALTFSGLNKDDQQYVIKKGSICVDGVSLTINDVSDETFSVMLIPHTLAHTNLHLLTVGSAVNIEFDYMVKLMVKRMNEIYSLKHSELCRAT